MKTVLADERGRITLGTKILEEYGRKFAVVNSQNEIVLVPISKNPISRLNELGKLSSINDYSIKELKKIAIEEAKKEALK